jgi:Cu(I)/Ag(I) efflux system membrane fusion protein
MNKTLILAAGTLLGLAAGYLLFGSDAILEADGSGDAAPAVEKGKGEPLFYRNPMNPAITSPVPARDHMGMEYIPVYAEDAAEEREPVGTVKIDPVVRQNIGLRTALAERKALSRTIRAPGRVTWDEQKLVRLHPRVEGWIDEIYIDKTGQLVSYDDILLNIYSPKLVATQQEYLLALKNFEALKDSPFEDIREGARRLVASARERLTLLNVPEHQIVELEASRQIKEGLHIHAPAAGTLLEVGVRQGQYVTPSTQLYLIADLSSVWVYADIYDYELPWVTEGDRVEMTLASVPGRRFEGRLNYVLPYAESKTRTTRVRLVFDNPDRLLRPEMFAEVTIFAAERPDQVVVPAEAVVRSGDYSQVFVVNDAGNFEPRRITTGVESRGEVAIAAGLEAGERVVVSAQFLVDSESSLRAATARMTEPDDGMEAMDHSTMDHGGTDHRGMDHGRMDHSTMEHGADPEMDHSQMDHSTMDHGGMDHSQMDHSTMGHDGMDHSQMDHSTMEHGAVSPGSHEEMNHD